MGLLNWLKRDTLKNKRRQSAPPIGLPQQFDPNATRGTEYIKALEKFNEWRTQRFDSDNQTTSTGTNTSPSLTAITICDEDAMGVHTLDANSQGVKQRSGRKKNSNRLSLPVPVDSITSSDEPPVRRPARRERRVRAKTHDNSIIEEVAASAAMGEELAFYKKESEVRMFEVKHCHNVSGVDVNNLDALNSPPMHFYKKNEQPYADSSKTPVTVHQAANGHDYSNVERVQGEYATPQRRNNTVPVKPSRRKKGNNGEEKNFNANGPLPKIRNSLNCSKPKPETDSEQSQFNGSYKNYDINSSSLYDEYVISSKGYKGNLNPTPKKAAPAPKPAVRKSISPKSNVKHTYQKVLNKHGEMVEYALPLNESAKLAISEEVLDKPKVKPIDSFEADLDKYDPIIDENFKFLTEKYNLNFSMSMKILSPGREEDAEAIGNNNVGNNASDIRQVTDLDKSDMEKSKDELNNRREIISELDALGRWAESINLSSNKNADRTDEEFNLNDFLFKNDTMIISYPNEVRHRTAVLRNTTPMPIELSSGIFRNTDVMVRKPLLNDPKYLKFSQMALRRDFGILKQVRHCDIAVLMAVVADRGVNQMQVVLEPFEFTLNYYLHIKNCELPLADVMMVVQRIASATNYLQESGYIHSNISSHSILMRENPICVKLAFFELTTDINSKLRYEIEAKYGNLVVSDPFGQDSTFNAMPDYALLLRGNDKYVKEKYKKLSKNISLSTANISGLKPTLQSATSGHLDVPTKYLPYLLDYRQQFSMYFYQAPELISTRSKFVFPNKLTDVYALNLLLWELLNNCIPYVIYSYTELEKLYKSKQALLPRVSIERCAPFEVIFQMGLEKDPVHRVMCVQDFIAILEDVRMKLPVERDFLLAGKKVEPISEEAIMKEIKETKRAMKESVNEIIYAKAETKEPFALKNKTPTIKNNQHLYENFAKDPQRRIENAITNNISLETFETRSTTTFGERSESEMSRDDPGVCTKKPVQRTNGELSNIGVKSLTPKNKKFSFRDRKPIQKNRLSPKVTKRSADNLFNLSQSTIFNSISDFNKVLDTVSPKNDIVYERTSTLKKKRKPRVEGEHVNSAINGEKPKSRCRLEDQLQQMDEGLKLSKEDFLEEVRNSPKPPAGVDNIQFDQPSPIVPHNPVVAKVNPSKGMVARARAQIMRRLIDNDIATNSQLSKTMMAVHKPTVTPDNRIIPFKVRSMPTSAPASYKFAIDNFALPVTPIARNNKLRRNAWLSDQKLEESRKELDFDVHKSHDDILNRSFTVETEIADELKNHNILSVEKVYKNPNSSSCNISLDESMKEKKINVSLKIIHNNLEIYNNTLADADDLSQKIQQIQLGMFEREGLDAEASAKIMKPEIKIKMTPTKNGQALTTNELDDGDDYHIGKQITDLTSEIRQCFENYDCDMPGSSLSKKIANDLSEVNCAPIQCVAKTNSLESPKLIQDHLQKTSGGDLKSMVTAAIAKQKEAALSPNVRFETALWHKEKSLCEKTSPEKQDQLDETETDWISVQEAIKRIESLSKSMSNSSKSKSNFNVGDMSVIQQSRLPNGRMKMTPSPNKWSVHSKNIQEPMATSSPLYQGSSMLFNTSLKPISLSVNSPRPSLGTTGQCCAEKSLVLRSSTAQDGSRSERPKRITTKVTLNLKKVQAVGDDTKKINQTSCLICKSCGTQMSSDSNSMANLSTSMIAKNVMVPESLSRRSSSCSTLLKMNAMEDLYIDDDFEDSFLTPNIELIKNDDYVIQFDG